LELKFYAFLNLAIAIGFTLRPNVVVEWLALRISIQEVSGSNLRPETGYPDRFFVIFISSSRQMPG
jgi:hypothetical protein